MALVGTDGVKDKIYPYNGRKFTIRRMYDGVTHYEYSVWENNEKIPEITDSINYGEENEPANQGTKHDEKVKALEGRIREWVDQRH